MSIENSQSMRQGNRAAVLQMVYDCGELSRIDIAGRTGLAPATLTYITADLLEKSYLQLRGKESAGRGRKPVCLSVNPDCYSILGAELLADSIAVILCDFCGCVIGEAEAPNAPDNTPTEAVDMIWRLARQLLQQHTHGPLLGFGLSSSGPYDRETGTLLDPPNFRGSEWKRAPIAALLQQRAGLPVLFERDAVACVLAENGAQDEILFAVMVNTVGIGGGMRTGHDVFYGLNSSASEIGHLTVLPNGPLCGCGDRGCLEAVSSGYAVASAWRDGAEVAALVDAYRAGDAAAVAAVEFGARCLGMAIGNIIKCVSPHTVAVGGRFISQFPEYYTLARSFALERHYVHLTAETKIVPFAHGNIQSAVGAVKLVLERFYKALAQPDFNAATPLRIQE